jgi:hypothetical protein
MHGRNRENIYWGRDAVPKPLISSLVGLVEPLDFLGHVQGSKYYWGDICRTKTHYVRQFETLEADTLHFDPATPYHDPAKPDVAWWFSASYGGGARLFDLLAPAALDQLARDGGASIIHTYLRHYGPSTSNGSPIQPTFADSIDNLAQRQDGWVVPVATLLDRLRMMRAISIRAEGRNVRIVNTSGKHIQHVALRVPPGIRIVVQDTQRPLVRKLDQVEVGSIPPGACVLLIANTEVRAIGIPAPSPNYSRLVYGMAIRTAWQFLHGRHSVVAHTASSRPH